MASTETAATVMQRRRVKLQRLAEDARVVTIALGHFAVDRDRFTAMVQRRCDYLERKLTPQWEARDEVKGRWGEERWTHNPHPKHTYARQRRDDERELRALTATVQRLETLDTADAYSRSQTIYETCTSTRQQAATMITATQAANSHSPATPNRYNRIRPNYGADRVSLIDQRLDHGQSGHVLLAVQAAALRGAFGLDDVVAALPDPQGIRRYAGQPGDRSDAVGAVGFVLCCCHS